MEVWSIGLLGKSSIQMVAFPANHGADYQRKFGIDPIDPYPHSLPDVFAFYEISWVCLKVGHPKC
jgi:hypothetical protein